MSADATKVEQSMVMGPLLESIESALVVTPTLGRPNRIGPKTYRMPRPLSIGSPVGVDANGNPDSSTSPTLDAVDIVLDAETDGMVHNVELSRLKWMGEHGDIMDEAFETIGESMGLSIQEEIEKRAIKEMALAAETAGNVIGAIGGGFSRTEAGLAMTAMDTATKGQQYDRFLYTNDRASVTAVNDYTFADRSGDVRAALLREGEIRRNFLGVFEGFNTIWGVTTLSPTELGYADAADLAANGTDGEKALNSGKYMLAYTTRSTAHIPAVSLDVGSVVPTKTKLTLQAVAMAKTDDVIVEEIQLILI